MNKQFRHTQTGARTSSVASTVAIFVGKKLAVQLKFKLDDRCSNIQAEQLAIFKAVQVISPKTDKKRKKNTK